MGAGASFGKRGKEDFSHKVEIKSGDAVSTSHIHCANILEGMPLVIEIPQRILYICDLIRNSECTPDLSVKIVNSMPSIKFTKELLVKDLMWLYDGAIKHATIDTFAKKLFLTGRVEDYNKLKKLLAIYFIIEQIINKPDSRYDTFLANILTPNLEIPERMKILTWNYDSQFEIAFNEYKSQINTPRDIGCYSLHDNDLTIQNNDKKADYILFPLIKIQLKSHLYFYSSYHFYHLLQNYFLQAAFVVPAQILMLIPAYLYYYSNFVSLNRSLLYHHLIGFVHLLFNYLLVTYSKLILLHLIQQLLFPVHPF